MIYTGDALAILQTLPDESVNCCITDPPYELGFMGKKWDKSGIAYNVDLWREVCRVLKPGAHLLAFGGSRTHHRIWCAIEDAGFEIRDTIMWVYGSGFPKSLDVSKAIDKAAGAERKVAGKNPHHRPSHLTEQNTWRQKEGRHASPVTSPVLTVAATDAAREWQGWGTALKPAYEPIVVARKPPMGTVVENVLKHGTGAINIDGCRIETDEINAKREHKGKVYNGVADGYQRPNKSSYTHKTDWAMQPQGRFPANVIHDGSDEVVGLFPETESGQPSGIKAGNNNKVFGQFAGGIPVTGVGDRGSAARFFYCAKASPSERGKGNNHPTVKPVALITYLVKLISRENDIILDPFIGSGTTGLVCKRLNRQFIGIELEEQYVEIAKRRIKDDAPLLCQEDARYGAVAG